MGIAASTLSLEFLNQKIKIDQVPIQLLKYFEFINYEDYDHSITIKQLIDIFKIKTDVYLSYSWGYHKKHYDKISKLKDILIKKELKVWFDEENIPITNHQIILKAIMNCSCVIIFFTQEYIDKVLGSIHEDHCKIEFNYIMKYKSVHQILPIILETKFKHSKHWDNAVSILLKNHNYIDMCCPITKSIDYISNITKNNDSTTTTIKNATNINNVSNEEEDQLLYQDIYSKIINIIEIPLLSMYRTLDFNHLLDKPLLLSINYNNCMILKAHYSSVNCIVEMKYGELCSVSSDHNILMWDLSAHRYHYVAQCDMIQQLLLQERIINNNNIQLPAINNINNNINNSDNNDATIINNNNHKNNNSHKNNPVTLNSFLLQAAESTTNLNNIATTASIPIRNEVIIDKPTKIIYGHTKPIYSIIQLFDERICTGGSSDGLIKIWNVNQPWNQGACDRTMRGHNKAITHLIQLKDHRIVSTSEDCTIKLWDISNNTYQCTCTLLGHTDIVTHIVQLQVDSKQLLCSSSNDCSIKIWDINTLQCIKSIRVHENKVNCVIELTHTQYAYLCTCSSDHMIKIWNITTYQCEKVLKGHWSSVTHIIQLHNGKICSCSDDMKIKIWDITDINSFKKKTFWTYEDYCIDTLLAHTQAITMIIELKDGRIASCSKDNTIRVWG